MSIPLHGNRTDPYSRPPSLRAGPPLARQAFQASDTGFATADTTGDATADDAQFAVRTLARADAETIAIHHRGAMPCNGGVDISRQSLDPSINGVAGWWTLSPRTATSPPTALRR
jgi:hypothetical protein